EKISMLQKCIDINHPVKELQISVQNYLGIIQNLPIGTAFDINILDVNFATFIGNKRKTKVKNTRDLIEEFHIEFLKLKQADRDRFIFIFNQTNDVQVQFANPATAIRLDNYPNSIQTK